MTLALRAMREAVEAPPRTGPVTDALRTMRAALPGFDADPDLRALRRAIADRIEADLAALDALGGDADLEDGADAEPSLCGVGTHPGGSRTLLPGAALHGNGEDLEQDEADDEPSLASLGGTAPGLGMSQTSWGYGGQRDRELQNEDGGDISDEPHDGDELEDGDDNGIGDGDGLAEQVGFSRLCYGGAA